VGNGDEDSAGLGETDPEGLAAEVPKLTKGKLVYGTVISNRDAHSKNELYAYLDRGEGSGEYNMGGSWGGVETRGTVPTSYGALSCRS
jgi:hypothetical protein